MSQHHSHLNARRWAAARRAAFDRDSGRCTECGKAGRLEAHHEPPLRDGADPYDLAGIVTYCRDCHIEHHRRERETPEQAEWRALVAEMLRAPAQ